MSFGRKGVIAYVSPEFKTRMRLLGVGGDRAFFRWKIRWTPGDQWKCFRQNQTPEVAKEWSDPVLESVAGDVFQKELMTDLLRLNAGQAGILGESMENREPDTPHASAQIQASRNCRRVLESIPGRGGIVDRMSVPALSLKKAQRTHKATDKNRETCLLFQARFSGLKCGMNRRCRD